MPLPRLVELFATGEIVGSNTAISLENGRFEPSAEYAELSRFMTSPALKWDADFPTDAIDRGRLDPARLPTRLFHLACVGRRALWSSATALDASACSSSRARPSA